MDRGNVYFMGASGTGKTKLANYVAKATDMVKLDSIVTPLLNEWGMKSFDEVLSDQELYAKFQKEIALRQIFKENELEEKRGRFVSDRGFDHAVFSALYGTTAGWLHSNGEFCSYMRKFQDPVHTIFLVRPCRPIYDEAVKQGRRSEFLDYDAMLRFDGAMEFIMASWSIPFIPITTPDWRERTRIVSGVLKI